MQPILHVLLFEWLHFSVALTIGFPLHDLGTPALTPTISLLPLSGSFCSGLYVPLNSLHKVHHKPWVLGVLSLSSHGLHSKKNILNQVN